MARFLLMLCCICVIACVESRQIKDILGLKPLMSTRKSVAKQISRLTSAAQQFKDTLGVVNGAQSAADGQFCYTARLTFTNGKNLVWPCTGSLIADNAVLTAGHCVNGAIGGAALLGAKDWMFPNIHETQTIPFTVANIKKHKKNILIYNDIAIIFLPLRAKLTKHVCTVKLPDCSAKKKSVSNSDIYELIGWGRTSNTNSLTGLIYTQVHGVKHAQCAKYYKKHFLIFLRDTQFCTNSTESQFNCNGDSGGPLVKDGVLEGIVSLGANSCHSKTPSIHTSVVSFSKWICDYLNKKWKWL